MFTVYIVIVYAFIRSERMPSQADPVPDPVQDPDPVPDPVNDPDEAVTDGEDSGSDAGSGSVGDSGGNTSEENQAFIDDLEEQAEYLDNEDEAAARLQAEMAELREQIAGHKSQLAQIRRNCGLPPWQRDPATVIKLRTVRYEEIKY